jgi:hypothetical protein
MSRQVMVGPDRPVRLAMARTALMTRSLCRSRIEQEVIQGLPGK